MTIQRASLASTSSVPVKFSSESDLRRELGRAVQQGEIDSEDRFVEVLREPFGTLDLGQRWSLMQDLLAAERQNPQNTSVNRGTLNASNFAVNDYWTLRAVAAGQPKQNECIQHFITMVRHGSGRGSSAGECGEGIEHLYGPLAHDKAAQDRFLALTLALENAHAAIYVEPMITPFYDEAVPALARVQAAQNRLGDLTTENKACWRTVEHFKSMLEGQGAGVPLQQSAQWIERFIDGGLKSVQAISFEGKGIFASAKRATTHLIEHPPARPWIEPALDVEEAIAAPLAPCERAARVAEKIGVENNPSQALAVYGLIAPFLTVREGFDKTLVIFDGLKAHDLEHARRFLENYVLTNDVERALQQTDNPQPPPQVQRTDSGDLVIGGVRVPVNKGVNRRYWTVQLNEGR